MPDSLPACHDLNETSQLYYGVDVDMIHRLFFICDKTNGRVQKVLNIFQTSKMDMMSFLCLCCICVVYA